LRYILACDSDVGKVKEENQDSLAVRQALLPEGEAAFAVLCDGMGGFEHGELASSSVVMAYVKWFEDIFIHNRTDMTEENICIDWEKILINMNKKIFEYGKLNKIKIGTTLTVLLLWNGKYHILNVGDCRAYEFYDKPVQITRDHSFVAREVEEGRMTLEEARVDSRRNQLLQCVGVYPKSSCDFYTGNVNAGSVFMMCCDGVRTKVNDDELFYFFHPMCMTSLNSMENNIKYIFELNKSRNETDNMSVILVKDSMSTMQLPLDDEDIKIQYEKTIISSDKLIV